MFRLIRKKPITVFVWLLGRECSKMPKRLELMGYGTKWIPTKTWSCTCRFFYPPISCVHLNPCFEKGHVQKRNQNALGQVCLVSTIKGLSLLVITSGYIWKMVDKELRLSGI